MRPANRGHRLPAGSCPSKGPVSPPAAQDEDFSDSRTRPASLIDECSSHISAYGRRETLLTGETGRQLSPWAIKRAMRKARGKVKGLPEGFRYHDLRPYFASLLIADVKTVQARLRHASAKTTLDTYGHISPDRDESTRAAIDAVLTIYRTEQRRNSVLANSETAGRASNTVTRRSRARTRAGAGAAGSGRSRWTACSPARSRSGPR